jgi:hypothetical protein
MDEEHTGEYETNLFLEAVTNLEMELEKWIAKK